MRGCLPVLVALAVIVAGAGLAVWKSSDLVSGWFAGPQNYSGRGSGSVTVEVAEGDTAGEIAVTLERAGVVASAEAFTDAAAADSRSLGIQPGFYALREQMSAKAALELLVGDAARIEKQVTLAEGLTVEQTLDELARQTSVPRQAYAAAARRGRLGLPAYAGGDPEGYLFPATYPLPPKVGAVEVLALMVDRFEQAAAKLGLVRGAARIGYTPAEVVTVASLVQAEGRRLPDFPKIAAVVYNRLRKDMALRLDSTVKYATGTVGDGEVFTTDKDRRNPSRYNTYRHPGLPPGPIASPGEKALAAALDPAAGKWTYFVTVDLESGRTLFADSYRAHQRNVARLRAYCAENRC